MEWNESTVDSNIQDTVENFSKAEYSVKCKPLSLANKTSSL